MVAKKNDAELLIQRRCETRFPLAGLEAANEAKIWESGLHVKSSETATAAFDDLAGTASLARELFERERRIARGVDDCLSERRFG